MTATPPTTADRIIALAREATSMHDRGNVRKHTCALALLYAACREIEAAAKEKTP